MVAIQGLFHMTGIWFSLKKVDIFPRVQGAKESRIQVKYMKDARI
jgi:hypothetical protein